MFQNVYQRFYFRLLLQLSEIAFSLILLLWRGIPCGFAVWWQSAQYSAALVIWMLAWLFLCEGKIKKMKFAERRPVSQRMFGGIFAWQLGTLGLFGLIFWILPRYFGIVINPNTVPTHPMVQGVWATYIAVTMMLIFQFFEVVFWGGGKVYALVYPASTTTPPAARSYRNS